MKIKKIFQTSFLLTSMLCLLIGSASVSADSVSPAPTLFDCSKLEGDVSYKTSADGSIKKVIEVKDVKQFSEQNNLRLNEGDKVTFVLPVSSNNNNSDEVIDIHNSILNNSNNNKHKESEDIFEPLELARYIKNVKDTGNACGTKIIRNSFYAPPGGEMTISEGVSASYTNSVTITASVITKAVGFDVAKSYNVSDKQTIVVPEGKRGELKAFPYYETKTFEIWEIGVAYNKKVGDGTALFPVGVCFVDRIY
ncbi:hypothetical protein [Paenibacillus sp. OSY-SE]|uniref:hypothetical protein n=1 Tax=Paenibacillus sp. OSY-SE TaxID=1196323 RepID=UPI00036AC615|nr:hypothetical protein [Paenibacillus sp. OSY-SE]